METLKFLMTTDTYPPYHIGGDAVHVKYLAEELANRGHEVHIVHSIDAYRLKKKFMEKKYEKRENVYFYPIHSPLGNFDPYLVYALGNSPFVYRKYRETLEKVRPDVVHHHNISLLGYKLLKRLGKYLTIYTAHSYWLRCPNQRLFKYNTVVCEERNCLTCGIYTKRPPQLWRYLPTYKKLLSCIDIIITPSNYVRNRISQSLEVRAVTIPNFVPEPPNPIEPSGFSNFFLYTGVLENHKGIMILVKLYKELGNKMDAKLLIAGDGSLRDKINGFVKRNGIESKIVPLGWVERSFLYRLIKDAYALVMPSIWPENCPLIALEAFSLGSPVIASNKGGLPEIVEKVDKSLIYNTTDRLRQVLLNFDKSRYPSYGVKAIYEKYYSPKAYLKNYFELTGFYNGIEA